MYNSLPELLKTNTLLSQSHWAAAVKNDTIPDRQINNTVKHWIGFDHSGDKMISILFCDCVLDSVTNEYMVMSYHL